MAEHNLEFLSLKGGYTGLSESTLVKMPHCWKSRVVAHVCVFDCSSVSFSLWHALFCDLCLWYLLVMVRPGNLNHSPSHHIDGVGSCLVLILQLLFIVFCLYMYSKA